MGYGHDIEQDVFGLDLPPIAEQHAVDFIIKTVMNNPGQITLVCIAPLTNIALAMIKEPRIIENVKQIILMGGVARLGVNGGALSYTEYNVQCDPEAASVVFSSNAPILMVGLDVTLRAILTPKEREVLAGINHPLNRELDRLITRWLSFTNRNWCAMHDPLAAALVLDRSLVRTENMRIVVEYDHRHPSGHTIALPDQNGHVEVALDVDTDRFMSMLLNVLK
jgi:purine nucleosidase